MSTLMRSYAVCALAGLALAASVLFSPAQAQSFEELVGQRAEELATCERFVTSEDADERYAAIQIALEREDFGCRDLAFETAMASDEPRLERLALRYWLTSRTQFTVDISAPENATDSQIAFVNEYKIIRIQIRSLSDNDEIDVGIQSLGALTAEGFRVPTGLRFGRSYCVVTIDTLEPTFFAGRLQCGGTAFPALISLN